jgi:predicted transcriptional regulator of viral defense system
MSVPLSQRLKILLNSGRSVFAAADLQALWTEDSRTTTTIAKRMVDQELLLKLAKGYYAISQDYNPYELANLIVSPSYVSFHSALFYWNVSFQQDDTISSVSLLNYKKRVGERMFIYYAMKESLFFNLEGVVSHNTMSLAGAERAILDSYYFGLLPNLDNMEAVNVFHLKQLASLYPRSVQDKVKKSYGGEL